MLRHAQRLGLVMGLVTAVMLACAPASAEGPSSNKTQNKKTQTKPAAPPSDAEDGAAKEAPGKDGAEKTEDDAAPSGGAGKCTGKATFCGVYSSVFCNSQPGCSYSYASKMCMGIAMDCEKAENATFCEKIKGCAWK
ncbi:hypothetical protein [Myxococcus qinghaiensis]|uniref:hypothetical protein n=1 Tax=Myxococcus qinghaiensis TaxID=2906758 RepID=UPI0020A80308|nr:hypothetical protein [Myxococcus qinghaiensis]MCP3161782.1 hypothetical protein [Myxococcus qinghaiensis]